jgi:hypothetical protein
MKTGLDLGTHGTKFTSWAHRLNSAIAIVFDECAHIRAQKKMISPPSQKNL